MYELLYQYILLHKKLSLPGLGCIALVKKPAQADFTNDLFLPPSYSFVFDRSHDTPSKKLFIWLANVMNITEWDAIKKVNDFSFELKQKINSGYAVNWNGVGTLHRSESGEIKFDPGQKDLLHEQPLHAEKVHRTDVEDRMPDNEKEKMFSEPSEISSQIGAAKKTYWWAAALIIAVSLVIFIGWYFSEKGLATTSAGAQIKLHAAKVPGTYRQMQ